MSIQKTESEPPISNSVQCGICLETTQSSRDCRLGCGHIYHSNCICKWIIRKNECPLCRVVIQTCDHLTNSRFFQVDKWDFLLGHGGSVLLECLQEITTENSNIQTQLETVQTELQLYRNNPVYLLSIQISTGVANLATTPETV